MTSKLKRVGLLGGTFDPVHNGHLDLAAETAQIFNLQKVFFIPVSRSPHKLDCLLTSSSHRVAMLKLALEQEATFSIDPLEIKKGGVSYTIDTLSCLKQQHPDWELFLILGADAFLLMDTWKSSAEILKLCHILVGTRPGVKLEISVELGQVLGINTKQLKNNDFKLPITLNNDTGRTIQLYQIPTQNISSRKIRDRVQAGKQIKNLLPPAVDHYIMRHQLYRTNPPPIMVWMIEQLSTLQQTAVNSAAEKKAFDILVLDLRNRSDLTDFFMICSGNSKVHVQSVVDAILDNCYQTHNKPLAIEGYSGGNWVVVDLGDLIVHVFHKEARIHYDLERLWGDVPVIKALSQ